MQCNKIRHDTHPSTHPPGWRKAHPAGSHWIDYYDGRDATEVMDAFHSEKARGMYQRLPKSKVAEELEAATAPDSATQLAFRQLRVELEQEGWWDRDMVQESKLLGIWASIVVSAALTAHSAPPLSFFLLSLAMTNAGWLGHDYIHGVDDFAQKLRLFPAAAAGLAPTWWSDKHNKHHALSEYSASVVIIIVCRTFIFVSIHHLIVVVAIVMIITNANLYICFLFDSQRNGSR